MGDLDRSHGALREWLARQLGGHGLRVMTGSAAFGHFVAAAPGAKELITIAKVWELAQLERWDSHNRTYDLVIVDAPSSGHGLAMLTAPRTFGEIARVGPVRRQAFRVRDMLGDPGGRATSPSRCPRRCRSTRRSSSGRGCSRRWASGSRRSWSTACSRSASSQDAGTMRAAADARAGDPGGADRVRARARPARHLRRLHRGAAAPVHTLPFLFEAEVGLPEYGRLGGRLARKL